MRQTILFSQERAVNKVLVIVIMSRSVSVAFNSNIIKATNALIEENYAAQTVGATLNL